MSHGISPEENAREAATEALRALLSSPEVAKIVNDLRVAHEAMETTGQWATDLGRSTEYAHSYIRMALGAATGGR